MRVIAKIIGIIPGAGHIWLKRYWTGILLFFLFANSLNAFFIGRFLWEYEGAEYIQAVALTVALFVWIFAYASLFRHSRFRGDDGEVLGSGFLPPQE